MGKKIIVSLFLCISIFASSLYADDASVPGTITAEAVKKGIKVSFKLKRSCSGVNVYRYVGDKLNDDEKQLVYENVSKKSSYSFVDECVNEGETYTYQLSVNGVYSEPVIAASGRGEVKLEVVPCEAGLQFTVDNFGNKNLIWDLVRYRAGDEERNHTTYSLRRRGNSCVDEYVDAGQEYIYNFKIFLKGNLGNDSYDHVFMPLPVVKIKSPVTGKNGDVTIINKPVATYDEATKTVTFTTLPEVGSGSKAIDINRTWISFVNDKGERCGDIFHGEKSFKLRNPVVKEPYKITGAIIGVDNVRDANDTTTISIYNYRFNLDDVLAGMPEIVK